jgi:hypothetical protein
MLCIPGFAFAAQDVEITGTYTCVGANADGGEYRGTVVISKEGNAYNLKWTIAGKSHLGLGIRQGDTLSAAWIVENSGGVVVYKIQKGPKLVGVWSEFGTKGKVLSEVLTTQD